VEVARNYLGSVFYGASVRSAQTDVVAIPVATGEGAGCLASPVMDQTTDTGVRGVTEHARTRPRHPAIVVGDSVLTYGDLQDRASRLASVLLERGAGPGRPVATVLPNGAEQFEVAAAASMLGAPYLPVNRHLKAAELAYIFDDADAAVVVGHTDFEGELTPAVEESKGSAPLVLVGRDYEGAIARADPLADADSGSGPGLMFYTSGTTARPKGVVHGAMDDPERRRLGTEGQVALWGWTRHDVYVMSGPSYHASHAGWALCALYIGATTVIPDHFEARAWLAEVSRTRGTRSFMVPAHFIRILEIPEDERAALDLSNFKLIVHAAAPCPIVVKQKMMEAFPGTEIHELYGASEGGATKISPAEWLAHPGSVGKPWPGVEIRILSEDGKPVATGETGLVYIRPPGGHRFSYRNDREATARAWQDDAFTVGDIGHLDEEGYLTITDRVSDMVLWGGVNIAPREIEEVLYQHPAVVDCAVFGIPDERDGERLKAIVQVRRPVAVEELEAHVRARLAGYKVPHVWEVVDELPRDQNGKVLKRLLRQAYRPES
jgi:long-chain acyl-CoA synthetase